MQASYRRNPSHPLWWDGAVAAFLQQAPTALADPEPHQSSPTPCRLSFLRSDSGLAVRHHGRIADRINKTEILQYDGAFLSLLDSTPAFPDQTTLRRFLKRLAQAIRQLVALHDRLRAQLFPLPRRRTTLTFDLDSVDLTVYGKQQFARVGYNPKKRGRRSYHPLICFEAHLQEFWHGSLRPGNTVTAAGLVAFLKRCLEKVPSSIAWSRVHIRGDSGCFGKRLVELLDTRGCGYAVVAKEYSTIETHTRSCHFRQVGLRVRSSGVPFLSTPPLESPPPLCGGATSHPPGPGSNPAIDALQGPKICLPRSGHQSEIPSVANLEVLCSTRHNRKNVRELLYDYPLSKISTDDWVANVAFFQLLLFAYNLVHSFKRLCLPEGLPLRNPRHHSHRFSGLACQAGKEGQSKRAGAPSGLSLPGRVQDGAQENRQTATTSIS